MCMSPVLLHRVVGVLHRVLQILHGVLGVLHRVLGAFHRVLGVLQGGSLGPGLLLDWDRCHLKANGHAPPPWLEEPFYRTWRCLPWASTCGPVVPLVPALPLVRSALGTPGHTYIPAYTPPRLVQRIGRTGRAGMKGVAYSFFSERDAPMVPPLPTAVSTILRCQGSLVHTARRTCVPLGTQPSQAPTPRYPA